MNTTNHGQYQPSRASGAPVREIMTRKVTTIQAGESVAIAEQRMAQLGIRHLPVLKGEELMGILSDRDIIGLISDGPLLEMPVIEAMTSALEIVGPDVSIGEASARMAARRIDCLPVVEGGKLVGIVTSSDILAERGGLAHKGMAGPIAMVLARDIMHKRILTIRAEMPLAEAMEALYHAELRYLPVVDASGAVIGMFGGREVRALVGDPATALAKGDLHALNGKTVDDVMRPGPVTVRDDASLVEVADVFLDERQAAVCVLNGSGQLVGIISYVDVLAALVGRKA